MRARKHLQSPISACRRTFTAFGLLSAVATLIMPICVPFGFLAVFVLRILQVVYRSLARAACGLLKICTFSRPFWAAVDLRAAWRYCAHFRPHESLFEGCRRRRRQFSDYGCSAERLVFAGSMRRLRRSSLHSSSTRLAGCDEPLGGVLWHDFRLERRLFCSRLVDNSCIRLLLVFLVSRRFFCRRL